MSETMSRSEQLFQQALLIRDARQRKEFLDSACGKDLRLREELDRMLAAHDQPKSIFHPDAKTIDSEASTGSFRHEPGDGLGTKIGAYKLLQQLGEGGFGVVYLAEQDKPVRRKVALKIIKPGMDSRAVVSRFEQERQALAMMDHPNIARVLDGGATEGGRPYFVMELVKGIPINTYCDQEHLELHQRMELFISVCQAVQHAHQKGIIHRDLKPSNVLVALHEGKPIVKIIDFGVAKAITQPLTDSSMFTRVGQMIGTLEYMAPEQAETSNLDIDTRADIYSLGVILYELLTGTLPLSSKELTGVAYDRMIQLIREKDPEKPSTRVINSRELRSIAAARKLEPSRLAKLMHREPDWIVMKCLEKERTRRYETADALALDVRRYLSGDPVLAGPPSRTYRLKKYARKYKGPIAAGCAFVLLLIAATVVSLLFAAWAREAESAAKLAAEQETLAKEAAQASAEKETIARQAAQVSEQDARTVLSFFEEKVLAAGRPAGQAGGLGKDVSLRAAVDAAESSIGQSFRDRPLVEASIRKALGQTYYYLGDPARALSQFEKAMAVRRKEQGPDHPETLKLMNNVAGMLNALGRRDEAIRMHEETLAIKTSTLGPDDPSTWMTMDNLAIAYLDSERAVDAVPLQEEVLRRRESKLGPEDTDTLRSRTNLANSFYKLGRLEEALSITQQTLALQEKRLGPLHPDTLSVASNLAYIYATLGRASEAIPLQERVLKQMDATLGPEHPDTLTAMHNLAWGYRTGGRPADALSLLDRAVTLLEARTPTDPSTCYNLARLHAACAALRESASSEDHAVRAVAWLRKAIDAGFRDSRRINSDPDFNALRTREDFQQLVAGLGPPQG